MNYANQMVLVQNANMNLINIRNYEVVYFSNFFRSFGTQAVIILGVLMTCVSQVPASDVELSYFWCCEYWISTSIACAASVHIIIVCLLLSIYGQGMAIRGPESSMIIAIQGMKTEQQQILVWFAICLFFFGLSICGMSFVMYKNSLGAILATVIMGIAIYCWYIYTLRIYNRFDYGMLSSNWVGNNYEDRLRELVQEDTVNPRLNSPNEPKKSKNSDVGKPKTVSMFDGVMKGLSLLVSPDQNNSNKPLEPSQNSYGDLAKGTTLEGSSSEMKEYSGYLTIRMKIKAFGEPWRRRYFVIKGIYGFIYKDSRAYDMNMFIPLNKRPIELMGYSLNADVVDSHFTIVLTPIDPDDTRKAWEFRCDTVGEYEKWVAIISNILKIQ